MSAHDDLRSYEGKATWEVVGDTRVPAEAQQLHEEGRRAGQRGDHDKALELFARATAAAPDWPYPAYDAAFTYLLMGDHTKAEASYRRVDEDPAEATQAIERGLACEADAETRGVLRINKAVRIAMAGDRSAAMQALGEIATDPKSTAGVEQMAMASLRQLVEADP